MNAKENDYICGTCKYYDYCRMSMKIRPSKYDTCDDWTDPAEPDLTEEERYDGGVMSNFDNENPKEVEDYLNEEKKD